MRFLDAAPTAYHAVDRIASRLMGAGFIELDERKAWTLAPKNGYFVRRQGSSIVFFRTGTAAREENGFRIAVAHTDSPGFKLKADSENLKAGGLRVTVEAYGSPIRATWFDRELGMAGPVIRSGAGGLETVLFRTEKPCALIPNIAVHLNREMNSGTEHNVQTDMRAVFSVTVPETRVDGYIRSLVAEELGIPRASIEGYDLYLFPAEKAAFVGEQEDMFMSGRIDNLAMSHAVFSSILEAGDTDATLVGALFDSEEVGSVTRQGAGSWFLRDVLRRISLCGKKSEEEFFRALAGSFIVSGDAAHAVHPNYSDKHDESFAPQLNRGPVIKVHAGQHYTTTADTGGRFARLCKRRGIPVQKFISRSDIPTGPTIGSITAAYLAVPSVDVGGPIWGMHSARETAGAQDQDFMIAALVAFFEEGLS